MGSMMQRMIVRGGILAGLLALPATLAAQDLPRPPATAGDSREFPAPRMVEGQPVETRPPEKADDKPLFPEQTRAPYHKTHAYKVTTLTDQLHLPWSIALQRGAFPAGEFHRGRYRL